MTVDPYSKAISNIIDAVLAQLGRTNARIDEAYTKLDRAVEEMNDLTLTVRQIIGTETLPGPLVQTIAKQDELEAKIQILDEKLEARFKPIEARDYRMVGIVGGCTVVIEIAAHLLGSLGKLLR